METIKQLLKVSRPISWPNTSYPFAAGYILTQPNISWLLIVGTLFFILPYNLLMYGINDVFDYESDLRNPRKGSIEGALSDRHFHKVIVIAALALAVPFLVYLGLAGTLPSNLVLAALIMFVLAYSVPYLRFKERPFIDSITSSLHFVGPLIYALSLPGFPAKAWPYVVGFFLWGMASHAFGAVQDVVPDRAAGIGSVATVMGAGNTVRLAALLYALACGLVALQGGASVIVGLTGLIYVLNVVPYIDISDAASARANAGWRRFMYLNFFTGFIVTLVLIITHL